MDGDRKEIQKGESKEKIIASTTFACMAYYHFSDSREFKQSKYCFVFGFVDGERPGLCYLQLGAHKIYHKSRALPKNEHTLSTIITAIFFSLSSKSVPIQSDINSISCFTTELLKSFRPAMRRVS